MHEEKVIKTHGIYQDKINENKSKINGYLLAYCVTMYYISTIINKLNNTDMTNSQIILTEAIQKRDEGKLDNWSVEFVSSFEHYTKKDLRKLSSKQYKKLREIAQS